MAITNGELAGLYLDGGGGYGWWRDGAFRPSTAQAASVRVWDDDGFIFGEAGAPPTVVMDSFWDDTLSIFEVPTVGYFQFELDMGAVDYGTIGMSGGATTPVLRFTIPHPTSTVPGDEVRLYLLPREVDPTSILVHSSFVEAPAPAGLAWADFLVAPRAGTTGNDNVTGTAREERLFGFAGNDTLAPRGGADTVFGGSGTDTLDLRQGYAAGVSLSLGEPGALGGGSGILVQDVERVIGTGFGDDLDGNSLANRLTGEGGGDTLGGKGGADSIFGGSGADNLTGGDGDDALSGGSEADSLVGGDGADQLDGGTGADFLAGGAGNDRYVVGSVGDTVFELEGRGRDEVRASVSYTLGDHVEALVLTGSLGTWGTGNGIGNRIDGNGGANRLSGGGGGDTILGGGGDDRIAGDAGQDRLTGGSGRDKFVFDQSAGGVNADRVTDFVRGSDTLLLENAVLTGIGEGGDLSSSRFAQGAATTDDHRVIYKASTGEILYDRDGDGGVAALRIGWVAAGLSLSASDFDVI